MSRRVPQLQVKAMRAGSSNEAAVYRAALEWNLIDPIVIQTRDDLKSERLWKDLVEPYNHQVNNLITFCRRLPVTLLADDVGLGKTISAGLIISELIARARLSKVLIVCPKLLGPQWAEELKSKFNIRAKVAVGKSLISADPGDLGAVITTYSSARLHLDKIPQDRFEMLVLDEAHKLRNLYGVETPPQVAVRFRKALEERRFRFVLMLTATPIHNRLWDLYSLIDLLTVARGHQNPFGSEGMFARKFIADSREEARRLKPEATDEFRSVIYSYMSRVRRGDAQLYFPDRVVQLHKVKPTAEELELIKLLAAPIQKLNRLAQISILQALTSSPHALAAQLKTMGRNGTFPADVAALIGQYVERMPTSAKLEGLRALIEQLKRENPNRWRLVVFTGRLETQTTIQAFLENSGFKVGIINGSSGPRNQETLARFRSNPPEYRVIVSTEAGSEGVNLQVANVLVNYDLPWNPMIVEQRIGRVQRLASEHASVAIFNVMLRGTFEEYIVGRLMEKLQMASHAIGDIEALLEASGLEGESESSSFEEQIRKLVVAALSGKDVEEATRKAELSITEAKKTLKREEENINSLLGEMDGKGGPQAPKLPQPIKSLGPRDFTVTAFEALGAKLVQQSDHLYLCIENGREELIRFETEEHLSIQGNLYAPGTPAFSRLVDRVVTNGVHQVQDLDERPAEIAQELAFEWVREFGGNPSRISIDQVNRCFDGQALVRIRVTVAHDSYERLVEVFCTNEEHNLNAGPNGLSKLTDQITNLASVGIDEDALVTRAKEDKGVAEFSRFYLERREEEVNAAGGDTRKRKKLEDDFTPRLEMAAMYLQGGMHRRLKIIVHYELDGSDGYSNTLIVAPYSNSIVDHPSFGVCAITSKSVPRPCLERCEISGAEAIRHLLARSEVSGRLALPKFASICAISGKRALADELEISAVTGLHVVKTLLRASSSSGKRAEPQHFTKCEFTGADLLQAEAGISEASGKRYRLDQQARSAVSDKVGHRSEFVSCFETRQLLLPSEAERCGATDNLVRPGVLEHCSVTSTKVLPSELERCAVTGKRVLKRLLVTSSVSQSRLLEEFALRSNSGRFCTPAEGKMCTWSGRKCHPEDILLCAFTGLPVYFEYITSAGDPRLQVLADLLDGTKRSSEHADKWPFVAKAIETAIRYGKCKIESAVGAPDGTHVAVCAEVRSLLGFRVHHVGALYSFRDKAVVGRIAAGKRNGNVWKAFDR